MESYDRQVEILFNKIANIQEDLEQLYYLNKNKVDLDVIESMQNDISGVHKRFDSLAVNEFVHIKDDIQHLYHLINANHTQLESTYSRIESNKRNDSLHLHTQTKHVEQMYLTMNKIQTNNLTGIYIVSVLLDEKISTSKKIVLN